MDRTTVVNVRGKSRGSLLADPRFLYCGRRCRDWPGSPWGNPFKPTMTLDQACRRLAETGARMHGNGLGPREAPLGLGRAVWFFNEFLHGSPDLCARTEQLRGRALGCWCLDWDGTSDPPFLCHCVVLALAAEGRWSDLHTLMRTGA